MSVITDKISYYYMTLQDKARAVADKNRAVAESDAEFTKCNAAFKRAEIELARAIVYSPADVDKLQGELSVAKIRRDESLKHLGLSDDLLQPKYVCGECSDTGVTKSGKLCRCYKKLLISFTLSELGVTPIKYKSFKEADASLTPYIDFSLFEKYAKNFPNNKVKTFVFSGSTGTGKTFLASCIANEVDKNGFTALLISAHTLNKVYLQCMDTSRYANLNALNGADLLIIDDLGSEFVFNKVTIENLLNTLDDRQLKGKHTIITTNLTQRELLDRYGDRIFSRLMDKLSGKFLAFKNDDIRLNKSHK